MTFVYTTPEQIKSAFQQGWNDCEHDSQNVATTDRMVTERYSHYSWVERNAYLNAGEDWEIEDRFRLELINN